jgi:hypothetical protein
MYDMTNRLDARIALRLPRELDQTMRESARFFGRSPAAEWRAAALLYRRVLILWASKAERSDKVVAGQAGYLCDECVLRLSSDLMPTRPSLETLRAALRTAGRGSELT